MSYLSPPIADTHGHPGAQTHVVPRGESRLLLADNGSMEVRLSLGTVASLQTHGIEAGHTLLVVAAERPVSVLGTGLDIQPVPDVLSRVLAFHDHTAALQRPAPGDRRQPAIVASAQDLRQPAGMQHWLMEQLLGDAPAFHAAAVLWARREAYQVIRFVLEHPDAGVQQLADRYGLSVAQFRRIGRRAFGRSLKEQLRLLRAGRVLQCYAETRHTFTRLSSDFGFSSPSHFCSEIKSLLGKSPRSIYQSVNSL